MPHHEVEKVDVPGPIPMGDKKSHLMSLWLGFGVGALVSALVVVATAVNG